MSHPHVTELSSIHTGPASDADLSRGIDVTSTVEDKGYFRSFFDQLAIMLKRNTILQIRYTKSTLSQTVIAPIVFMLLLFVLQKADFANQEKRNAHPTPSDLQGIYNCQGLNPEDPCINIMYTPQNPQIDQFMTVFARKNANRTGESAFKIEQPLSDLSRKPTTKLGMVPVPNADFIYNYTLNNPNTTYWGITFTPTTSPIQNIAYQIWYNASNVANASDIFGRQVVSFMRGMDEAIISVLNDPTATVIADLDVTLKDWPLIPPKTLSDTIVQNLGPVFFFCAEMVIFINVLNLIVTEKEQKLRHGMEMMGLKPGVYWISHFLSNSLLVAIGALVTSIFGLIFGFSAFRNTHFMVLFFTFFLFGEGMLMFAFFITTMVRRARVAILIGIFMFIIGLLFESFVFSGSFVGYIWWDQGTSPVAWKILMFLPFFNFGKIFLDITTYTTGKLDVLTQTYIPGPGFQWNSLYAAIPDNLRPVYGSGTIPDIPPPVQSWYFLLFDMAVYAILTWYLDNVIPNEFGYSLPPWFFLTAEYWGIEVGIRKGVREEAWLAREAGKKSAPVDADEDGDVLESRQRALDASSPAAVRIVNLRKVYRNGWFKRSKEDKVAVKNLCLSFEEGKLLALLGQNGAGKSTTMNILSGLTPSTSGDALMYGFSVRNQMHRIRKIMGVCPQHDILFEDLTAREHVRLYAGLKGVPKSQWETLTEDRLKQVRLWKVADQRAGTYSGGMKRRLSMVISTIGDPKIIFMDEPTTGMDPVNRRHVWEFVEKFKKGRVIVLTTHSMEEADVLGDRIAIMAHGRLRAIGNSISLKNKYGAGYRISIVTDPDRLDATKQVVASRVPNAVLEDDSAGALIYQFPITSTHAIPGFVKYLDSDPEGLIRAWGISQTTLEEVFLKLIRDANPNGYSGYEQNPDARNADAELTKLSVGIRTCCVKDLLNEGTQTQNAAIEQAWKERFCFWEAAWMKGKKFDDANLIRSKHMKFSKEYSAAYRDFPGDWPVIQYKALKKSIRKIVQELEEQGLVVHQDCPGSPSKIRYCTVDYFLGGSPDDVEPFIVINLNDGHNVSTEGPPGSPSSLRDTSDPRVIQDGEVPAAVSPSTFFNAAKKGSVTVRIRGGEGVEDGEDRYTQNILQDVGAVVVEEPRPLDLADGIEPHLGGGVDGVALQGDDDAIFALDEAYQASLDIGTSRRDDTSTLENEDVTIRIEGPELVDESHVSSGSVPIPLSKTRVDTSRKLGKTLSVLPEMSEFSSPSSATSEGSFGAEPNTVVGGKKRMAIMVVNNGDGTPNSQVKLNLKTDTNFFRELANYVTTISQFEAKMKAAIEEKVDELSKVLTDAASPYRKDLYAWRKFLAEYLSADIWLIDGTKDRPVASARLQLQSFADVLKSGKMGAFKLQSSQKTLQYFLNLNHELLNMKQFDEINHTAVRKILKKHDKRTQLTASSGFPLLLSRHHFFTSNIARMLVFAIQERLVTIVPQPDDYGCPICQDLTWKPVRLRCGHVFCVRCLVKAQVRVVRNCPVCRAPDAVHSADQGNLDVALMNFLKLYFPREVKAKADASATERAAEEVGAILQHQHIKGLPDADCIIM
ncbi:ATP-binding cassette sub- A member 1 [Borealophlyctis nickersoniae]|nr:ATP-binding cassette sub- A member 1 [Borealophlyctis nickersoniae]